MKAEIAKMPRVLKARSDSGLGPHYDNKNEVYDPQLSVVLVQKRVSQRFLTTGSKSVPRGTVADTNVVIFFFLWIVEFFRLVGIFLKPIYIYIYIYIEYYIYIYILPGS